MKRILALLTTSLVLLLRAAPAWAHTAGEQAADSSFTNRELLLLLVGVVALLGFVLLVLALALILLVQYHGQRNYQADSLQLPSISLLPDFGKLWASFVGSRAKGGAQSKQADVPLDHSYDGITELDNAAPPLFTYILYGTILFALVYMVRFHVVEDWGMSQQEEFLAAMEEGERQKQEWMKKAANQVDETNVTYLNDPARLAEGEQIYLTNCQACHGQQLQGMQGLGPNLTDEYWLHGGGAKNVFATIKYGVKGKSMAPWQQQLTPAKMASVTSYILSKAGSNPPNAREPEGELWSPEQEAADQGADTTNQNTPADSDPNSAGAPAPKAAAPNAQMSTR